MSERGREREGEWERGKGRERERRKGRERHRGAESRKRDLLLITFYELHSNRQGIITTYALIHSHKPEL